MRPIEEVAVGALVAAVDPVTGLQRWRPVTARMSRLAPQIVRLTLEDAAGNAETILVTPSHPYLRAANDNGAAVAATSEGLRAPRAPAPGAGPWTLPEKGAGILNAVRLDPGGDWTAAGLLQPGDKVPSARGGTLTVVASELATTPTRVYNLEVAGEHTYAAGDLQAWVHNAKWPAGITGFTKHGLNQAINRGIRPSDIIEAISCPLRVADDTDRNSRRYVGKNATVIMNPAGVIVTLYRSKRGSGSSKRK